MNGGTPTDPALAARLHREAVVIDGLNASHFQSPVVLERLLAGGVTAVNITVAAWHGQVKTMCQIGEMYEILAALRTGHGDRDGLGHRARQSHRTGRHHPRLPGN